MSLLPCRPDTDDRPNEAWCLLENHKVFEASGRLRVMQQTLAIPGKGIIDDYYQINLPSFATIYAVTEVNEVLMLRQYKHGVGHSCLTLPGGTIDPGEDAEFSARRELLEETGYGGGLWLTGPSLVLHGNQRIAISHIFVAQHVIKLSEANSGDLEEASITMMPREVLKDTMLRGHLPIASHVATVGIAEALLTAR